MGEEFVNVIRAKHQGHLMRKKLRALHYAAQVSIGIEAGAWSVSSEISFLVEKLRLIKRQVRNIDETLARLVDETEEGKYLLSIIGLNYTSVAGLLAELGACSGANRQTVVYFTPKGRPVCSESLAVLVRKTQCKVFCVN